MKTQTLVQFKKERDLGAIITDSFKFIRQEWKPFFSTIIKASILPLLFSIAAMAFYLWSLYAMSQSPEFLEQDFFSNLGSMLLIVLVLMLAALVTYVIMQLSSLHYIKQYIQNDGKVDYHDVITGVKNEFWSMLGLSLLVFLTAIVSLFLCFLPIIYVWPIISLMPVIYVFGKQSALDSYGLSFSLVGARHWGNTFGIMFVISLLVFVLGYVFSIPQIIYQLFKTFTMLDDNDPTAVFSLFSDPIYLVLLIVGYVGKFFLYAVSQVTNVFIYFDIDEQENSTGTINTIDSIGQ